jgi:hypothetical protein
MSSLKSTEISGEKISYNSRAVLLGLFVLVGFILAVYTFSVNVFPPEESGRLNTVFIAAVSGALALGGTLISQLWGKKTNTNLPIIFATIPDDTATQVSPDSSISASFNVLMDKSTINSKTFTLKDNNNAVVDATISLEGGNAILKPASPLNHGSKYTAKITKDVKSISGEPLGSDKEWSFTTV